MAPRGWYLAQGLYPLTPDSDDDDGPCELPNGKLVCGRHGLVWCGICCVDYSFVDEEDDEDEKEDEDEGDEDDDNLKSEAKVPIPSLHLPGFPFNTCSRGTGPVFPTELIQSTGSKHLPDPCDPNRSRLCICRVQAGGTVLD